MMLDRRVSLNMLCYPYLDLPGFCAEARNRAVQTVGLHARRFMEMPLADVQRRVTDCGLSVSTLVGGVIFDLDVPSSWSETRDRLDQVVEAAAELGAPTVYLVSGARPKSKWDDPLSVLAEAIAPSVEKASATGICVAVEPTSVLRADISFIHTITEAIELAKVAGTGICLDLFHVWAEIRFKENVEKAVPYITHVQLSDYVRADQSRLPGRAVPGDGDLPLELLLSQVRGAGYQGPFDLELYGPRIDAEGHSAAVQRALTWLAAALG
jgi:sugar phosphate isomerase/epimerase